MRFERRRVRMAERDRPKRHGPWVYDAEHDWIGCDGRAWGTHIWELDTPASLQNMMDHLERKDWCTTAMLGEFWVAVRYWLWRKNQEKGG